MHFNFGCDPLISVVGLGFRTCAVRQKQLSSHHDIGTRSAKIKRSTIIFTIAAQKLNFDGGWEVLIYSHQLWIFAMQHQAVIANGPAGSTWTLSSHKAIFDSQTIVRKRFFEEQVSKLLVVLWIRFGVVVKPRATLRLQLGMCFPSFPLMAGGESWESNQ